jgi:tetratricopeptide (TPR) repeat protein
LEELQSSGLTQVTIDGERAIATVLDAGYRRLTDRAQRAYRVLGTLPGDGGVSPTALGAVMKLSKLELAPVVRELVHGKRMVDQIDRRLRLDALVREHARTIAHEVDGTEVVEARNRAFVRWLTNGALAADRALQPGRPWSRQLFGDAEAPPQDPREWMLAERVALRSAVELAADLGDADSVFRLCVAQWWLYESQKYTDDLIATHDLAPQVAEGNPAMTALLKVQKGYAERTRARFTAATPLLTEAADLARSLGDLELEATAIEGAGLTKFDEGDLTEAARLLDQNVELARQIGDPRRTALACLHAAKPAERERASALLTEAAAGFRGLDQPEPHNLAKVLLWQGRKLDDRDSLDQALAIMTEQGRDFDRAEILTALGATVDGEEAARCYRQAAQIYADNGHLVAAAVWEKRAEELG